MIERTPAIVNGFQSARSAIGRPRWWSLCWVLLFLLIACGSRTSVGSGNTNWKLCESNDDCSGAEVCECNVCAPRCNGELDCSEVPESMCESDDVEDRDLATADDASEENATVKPAADIQRDADLDEIDRMPEPSALVDDPIDSEMDQDLPADSCTSDAPASNETLLRRMGQLLWGNPNEPALEAFAGEDLKDKETRIRVATEMAINERATAGRVRFLRDWLGMDRGPDALPMEPNIAASVVRATDDTLAYLVENLGLALPDLFRSNQIVVDEVSAAYYGLVDESGEPLTGLQTIEERPAGVLTQAHFLSMYENPSTRGNTVLKLWFCNGLPPHPPEIEARVPETEAEPGVTLREQYEAYQEMLACSGCHELVDPTGFLFGEFGPNGEYYEGRPVDTTGSVYFAQDPGNGEDRGVQLSGVAELSELIATQLRFEVTDCATRRAFEYAGVRLDRAECDWLTLNNLAQLDTLPVDEWLVQIVATESFAK